MIWLSRWSVLDDSMNYIEVPRILVWQASMINKIDAALGRCHSQSIVRLFKTSKASPIWAVVSSNDGSDRDIPNSINETRVAFHKPDLNKDFSVLRQAIAIRLHNLELYSANDWEDSAFHKSMLLENS